MARGKAESKVSTRGVTSSRFLTGTKAITGDWVATAEPVVEQTGQKCEAEALSDRSEQKWNCAPRKMTPSSNARIRME